MEMDKKHIERLSKRLLDRITSRLSHVVRNGDPERTYQGTLVTFINRGPLFD